MAVIDAVERFLGCKGFVTERKVPNLRAHGDDLAMRSPSGVLLHIEAKGMGSSDSGSARYRPGFDLGQKKDHFGKALVWATKLSSEGAAVGIALPADPHHISIVLDRKPALERLGVLVFLVSPDTEEVSIAVGALIA